LAVRIRAARRTPASAAAWGRAGGREGRSGLKIGINIVCFGALDACRKLGAVQRAWSPEFASPFAPGGKTLVVASFFI